MSETTSPPPAWTVERTQGCPFDPPPSRSRLISTEPVSRVALWDGGTGWLVSNHADQVKLLRDTRLSADIRLPGFPSPTPGLQASRLANQAFISMDDPEHAVRRRAFTGDFTVKRLGALRPRIEAIVSDLLDDMEQAGPGADLVSSFALPLPSLVICELLGVPYADHAFFQRISAVSLNVGTSPEQSRAASTELAEYLGKLLDIKRGQPDDSLLSRMANEHLATGHSTKEDCVREARLLLVAGHETTANMIALGTLALLRHPDQLALVRDGDADLVANAVEELLRYLSIVHMGRRRVALADIEVGGHLIKAGDAVICATDTANRDPAVFPDPDRLDVSRPARLHLAFGSGPHQCLGQNLARAELQVAYPALLRRFPGLRLNVALEDIPFRTDMAVYGVHELPVGW